MLMDTIDVHGIMGGEAVPDFGNNIQQFVLK